MPSTREYRRIFRRLFVTHLGLALLPLVALGIFSIDRINSIYDEKISAGIEAVCSSKHRALDTFLHERVSQIKTLAFTHDLAELRDPDRLSRIFTVMQQSGRSFVDLGIIGMDGIGAGIYAFLNRLLIPTGLHLVHRGSAQGRFRQRRVHGLPQCAAFHHRRPAS